MNAIDASAWPLERAAEAVEALAQAAGLPTRATALPRTPPDLDGEALDRYLMGAAEFLDVEIEPLAIAHDDAAEVIARAGPALVRLPGQPAQLLALVAARRGRAQLVGPDGVARRVPLADVRAALCGPREAPLHGGLDATLASAGVRPAARARVRSALLDEQLAGEPVSRAFLLRAHPGASFRRAASRASVFRRTAGLVALHTLQYGLGLLGWWLIGRGALSGRLESGFLVAWLLLLLTLVPLRLLGSWLAGQVALDLGALLKQRLLAGALALDAESIRLEGAGQLLGRVIESSAVEQLAISGAFAGLIATLELGFAALVLAIGAGGWPHALLLVAWSLLGVVLQRRYYRKRARFSDERLTMTHELVERMVGHRTRLAQEDAAHWHDGEDHALARYLADSRGLDDAGVWAVGLLPRGWLCLGLLGLLPAFTRGGAGEVVPLAVGLGGVLLAYAALRKLAPSLPRLAGALIAWRAARPLLAAAARVERAGSPAYTVGATANAHAILEAHELVFRYRDRGEPVLRGASLTIRAGDRLLVEGPSGGGKSTLASLLVGLREPSSGLLLAGGLDRATLGAAGWRRRVTAAPQFHENHLLTNTLAFNLLLGRAWPPTPDDLDDAEALCRELSLGPLLDRMPAGLQQMVGETGWQLSHGERSRVYLARALLSRAELIVLDESFGALDPETLREALACVLRRAPTLLVIAHP